MAVFDRKAHSDAADEIVVGQSVAGASNRRAYNYYGTLLLIMKAFGGGNVNGQVDLAGNRK